MSQHIISLIGNPNCGKTTVFNALTGSRQRVGNWPGVTVDKKTGNFSYDGHDIEVVDLPGIYSVTPTSVSGEDEVVARNYLLSGEAQVVVNIIDASNLERNLYLTSQLIEMGVPVLVVVNMLDIAKQHKIKLDLKALENQLGCPVVGLIANRNKGVDELKKALVSFLDKPAMTKVSVHYNEVIEKAVAEISAKLSLGEKSRWFAVQLLEHAPGIESLFEEEKLKDVLKIVEETDKHFEGNTDIEITNARYQLVSDIAEKVIVREGSVGATLTDRIDRIILNRWMGLPIFLLIMYVTFLFTQNFGAVFIDFFDILVGGIFVEGLGQLLASWGTPEWLTVFLSNGIGGGLQTISTFIPVVFFMFLFLAILEESGYMARAAFVMDRLMRALGLPGKAFVPLLVGFGCNVPAIMATRTMDRASDRIITVMMTPFMSCGARLPVYVLFATAFWPTNGQNLVFGLYLIGIAAAILTGYLLKRTALPGAAGAFVMEMPPYHIPTLKGVMIRTWDRVRTFMFRAGKVIVVIVACLAFLNSMGTDGTFGNEDSEKSVLSEIGKTIVPVFEPMGIQEENWPAAVGVFTGIFAKEAVVGTLNSLYDTLSVDQAQEAAAAATEEPEGESSFSLSDTFSEAVGTIGENFAGLAGAFSDPLGISVGDLSDEAAAAEEQGVSLGTIDTIKTLFGSTSGVFAYLLMVLLYVPCVAAVAAIYREVGTKWTIFACAWTLALGYSAATIFYRVANFAAAPVYSIVCIVIALAILYGMYCWMKSMAKKDAGKGPKIIPIIPVA
mgnify:FL=1